MRAIFAAVFVTSCIAILTFPADARRLSPMTRHYVGTVTTLPNFSNQFVHSIARNPDDGLLYIAQGPNLDRLETDGSITQIATFSNFVDTLVWDENTHLFYVTISQFSCQVVSVSATGATNVIAGSFCGTSRDGSGSAAVFNNPTGMVVDPVRHIFYVADFDRIRVVTENGAVTTVGGIGVIHGANFGSEHQMALDIRTGSLAITDTPTNAVYAFAPGTATYSLIAGRCLAAAGQTSCVPYQLDGPGYKALFGQPAGIAYDPNVDALFVGDALNFNIRRIDAAGNVTTIAGNGRQGSLDGTGVGAEFVAPACAVFDPAASELIVCDNNGTAVRVVTSEGRTPPPPPHGFVMRPAPTLVSGPVGMTRAFDGSLWFAESTSGYLGRMDAAHHVHELVLPGGFSHPYAVALGIDGAIRFADSYDNAFGFPVLNYIAKVSSSGKISETAFPNHCGSSPSAPNYLTPDPAGSLWFAVGCPSAIGFMTTQRTFVQYVAPQLFGLAIGLGAHVWGAGSSQILEYSTAGVPLAAYDATADGGDAVGPDGMLWFLASSGVVGKLDPATGNVTNYQLPSCGCSSRNLTNLTAGPDGALWFTEGPGRSNTYPGAIGRMTIDGSYTEYPIYEPRSAPSGIGFDLTGRLWISDAGANKIGYLR